MQENIELLKENKDTLENAIRNRILPQKYWTIANECIILINSTIWGLEKIQNELPLEREIEDKFMDIIDAVNIIYNLLLEKLTINETEEILENFCYDIASKMMFLDYFPLVHISDEIIYPKTLKLIYRLDNGKKPQIILFPKDLSDKFEFYPLIGHELAHAKHTESSDDLISNYKNEFLCDYTSYRAFGIIYLYSMLKLYEQYNNRDTIHPPRSYRLNHIYNEIIGYFKDFQIVKKNVFSQIKEKIEPLYQEILTNINEGCKIENDLKDKVTNAVQEINDKKKLTSKLFRDHNIDQYLNSSEIVKFSDSSPVFMIVNAIAKMILNISVEREEINNYILHFS